MTLPATGSCGAAGTETGAGAAACGRGCGGGPLDEVDGVEETGGVADGGRDQPGPVVVDKTGAAVSLVVTSRECVLIGGATGRTATGRYIAVNIMKHNIELTSWTARLDDRYVVQ
jgi:hypothetical protein